MEEKIKNFINKGECINVEFKEASNNLPENLFESVCAMLNRSGGYIILGVSDSKNIVGIPENKVAKLKIDFSNLCNNPEKIYPTVYLTLSEIKINTKTILYCYISESSNVHSSAGKVFDRNEDGDYDITNNPTLISNLYIRKSSTYIENKIFKFADIKNDLRKDIIARARQMAVNKSANHFWAKCSDIDFLRSASLYVKNRETGEEGLTLAAILLLGRDEVITTVLSHYKTDAILKVYNTDRYDDRDDIRTNLLDSYDRLVDFIKKHISDNFYLEDGQRVSTRDIIARELCANLLVHREYSNPQPARLIITTDAIRTENANRSKFVGYIDIHDYSPYPKNPVIASFFKEIGLVDELGSGLKKIAKYTKIQFDTEPIFKEDDIFKSEILRYNIDVESEIITYITQNEGVSRNEINKFIYPKLGTLVNKHKNEKVRYYLRKLSESKKIQNIGNDRRPCYIINTQ